MTRTCLDIQLVLMRILFLFGIIIGTLVTVSCTSGKSQRSSMTKPKDEETNMLGALPQPSVTTLSTIPSIKELKELSFSCYPYSPTIQEEQLKRMWATAKPISANDPMILGWQYSPWIKGTFSTVEGKYTFEIFLGGLGTLDTPNGQWGYFLVDAKVSGIK